MGNAWEELLRPAPTTGDVVVNYTKPSNDARNELVVTTARASTSFIQLREAIKVSLGTVHGGSCTAVCKIAEKSGESLWSAVGNPRATRLCDAPSTI